MQVEEDIAVLNTSKLRYQFLQITISIHDIIAAQETDERKGCWLDWAYDNGKQRISLKCLRDAVAWFAFAAGQVQKDREYISTFVCNIFFC